MDPQALRDKVEAFPRRPGVYLMKDSNSEVIYVGKAVDLRARVRSYFLPPAAANSERLIESSFDQVADIDFVVTRSEVEALILENNFIKQFRPRYNVVFRDDKSYLSIAINLEEPWPRPVATRRLGRKGTLYFGPYASARSARATLRAIYDLFPLRRCSLHECARRSRPCQYAEMGKCLGPCTGEVTEDEYRRILDQVILFLRGRAGELVDQMERDMLHAAGREDFEAAARLRDRLAAVRRTLQPQDVGSSDTARDRDVFGFTVLEPHTHVAVLIIRDGNLQDVAHHRFRAGIESPRAALASFVAQFYAAREFIPDEVLLPVEIPDAAVLQDWLSQRRGRKVTVACPSRGAPRRLVQLATENVRHNLDAGLRSKEAADEVLESLRRILDLDRPPRRIECFDISTLGGHLSVGSMAVFEDARPAKDQYRRYRIRHVAGQDDFAMLHEVLTRRLRRARDEHEFPDLIVIDGGRGQLSSALEVLRELDAPPIPVVALAKQRTRRGRRVRVERVFLPGRARPVRLDPHTGAFQTLTAIRDEAHRFAIAYHRRLRSRPLKTSRLLEIPGVGPALRKALMKRFGSVSAVRNATAEELRAVPGVGPGRARAIREFFDRESAPQDVSP
jgi:excinuclease ABC subunit C